MAALRARALPGLPEIRPGDDLGELIVAAMQRERPAGHGPAALADGQLVVIAHKAVSKAEGALVALSDVEAGPRARELALDAAASAGREPTPARSRSCSTSRPSCCAPSAAC